MLHHCNNNNKHLQRNGNLPKEQENIDKIEAALRAATTTTPAAAPTPKKKEKKKSLKELRTESVRADRALKRSKGQVSDAPAEAAAAGASGRLGLRKKILSSSENVRKSKEKNS